MSKIEKRAAETAKKEAKETFVKKEIISPSFAWNVLKFLVAVIMFFFINEMSSGSDILRAVINIILPLAPMAIIYPMQFEQHRRTYVNKAREKKGKKPYYKDLFTPGMDDNDTRGALLLMWQLVVYVVFLPTWAVSEWLIRFPAMLEVNAFMRVYSVCDYFYENHLLGFVVGFFFNYWLMCGGSKLIEELKGCVSFKNGVPQIDVAAILTILKKAINKAVILPVKCGILTITLTVGIYFSLGKEAFPWL